MNFDSKSAEPEARLHFRTDRQDDRTAVQVSVPASTSNLGSGFDCCGLALKLYLTVRATVRPDLSSRCRIRSRGEGAGTRFPRTSENLIFRTMQYVAEREGLGLPPVRMAVYSEIPAASGLGSSGAAIIAGATLCGALCRSDIPRDRILRYASELEGHADNVAAALLGGWVVNCVEPDGNVTALKRDWPADLKVIAVTPQFRLETNAARAALPSTVTRADAVYNLQRVALFNAALEKRDYGLLWEAMKDRLHQPYRQGLVPGLTEALSTPRLSGLIGLALSGSGPSVLALAEENFAEIGERIASCFRRCQIDAAVRLLEVSHEGCSLATIGSNPKVALHS
jgi:homoserine kinase